MPGDLTMCIAMNTCPLSALHAAALLAAVSLSTASAGTPPEPVLLDYVNHWAGNTGGKGGIDANADVISNFVVDIGVLNAADVDWQMQPYVPLVITQSYWDETRWADGAYSAGVRVSKGEFFKGRIAFDSTTFGGITATIAHPRALDSAQRGLEDQGCPLRGYADNLPYVALSDGRTITSVAYPTSVAFDRTGRLWVADNGPDQNFKIFTVPDTGDPVIVDTFGETGGVFAGPVSGLLGPKRFWGVRGVGFGDAGEIIVGCSGIPGQTQGGTDVRWFDATGTTMEHQAVGTFMHVADFDPESDGADLYAPAVRYAMDYSKAPGASWSYAAVTLDPFRFPEDPRLFMPLESAFVRRIGGRKFLFCTSMHERYLAVFRFEPGSEIAIPAAFLGLMDDGQRLEWAKGLYPTWTSSETPRKRYMWLDHDGNGRPDAGEFSVFEVANQYSKSYDVDADGNIWMGGGMSEYSTYWKAGGTWVLPCQGLDANGVPLYTGAAIERLGVPEEVLAPQDYDISHAPVRVRYLASTDTLLLGAGMDSYFPVRVYVIDGYRHSPNPTRRCLIDLGHDRNGAWAVRLDQGTAAMSLPACFAADDDYLYVAYLDGGRDEHQRGEVTVYRLQDGHEVGWLKPTADTNFTCGATDLLVGIQVAVRADGSRLVCLEDNGGGKVMVYHWTPPPAGDYPSTTGSGAVGPVIVTQPPKVIHPAFGRSLTIGAVVVGQNLQFQWKKDGADIAGANSATFTKAAVTAADEGEYTLTVWNTEGTVASETCTVSLVYGPVITDQPAALTRFQPDSSFSLSVSASGEGVLRYQWYKDGVALANASAATYAVDQATATAAGTYSVVVTNYSPAVVAEVGSVTSASAVVRVGPPPFTDWIAGYFPTGTAEQTAADADPDGDGLNNLLEYGLGRAPNAPEAPLAPLFWTDPANGDQHDALTFRRAIGVTVVAEISEDLVHWSSDSADLVQEGSALPDASGLYETVTYRSTAPTTAKPRQFLRVRVTAP